MMSSLCSSNQEDFINLVTEKLARVPIDFLKKAPGAGRYLARDVRKTAGVLLLLTFKDNTPAIGSLRKQEGGFYFLLIKRSAEVAQPGDLSCPGGMLDPIRDSLLARFIRSGWPSNLKGKGLDYARLRDRKTYRLITLYLTNALRESWEEIGLSPFNVRFLGTLPTYDLILFQRTIFPSVGFIQHPWHYKTNREVEQIIEIPLQSFFDQANFGRYVIRFRNPRTSENAQYGEFPCLICRDGEENEHILWGATFYIIINFLKTVLDYELIPWQKQRIIRKDLPDHYASQGQSGPPPSRRVVEVPRVREE